MPGYVLGNFFIYSVINAFTPGSGNILALNTVTNYGYKKGKPLFWGIFAGYYVVQIICAVFVFGVSTFLPNVLGVMKYVGTAYILWLAVHIALSKPTTDIILLLLCFNQQGQYHYILCLGVALKWETGDSQEG